MQNNDYERVVKEINEYNNERNSVDTINQPMNKQYEPSESGQDSNYVLKGSVSSDSTEENSNKTETNPESNSPETPKEFDSLGKVLSGSNKISDFVKAVGKDAPNGEKVLQKALATFNSPEGIKIEIAYNSEIKVGVQKILKECVDSMKAMKIAGKIADKVSKYLAFAYILNETIEGYQQGGISIALGKFKASSTEIARNYAIETLLSTLGLDAIPIFISMLIIEFIIHEFEHISKN